MARREGLRRAMRAGALPCLGLLALLACKRGPSTACREHGDCRGGEVCVEGRCTAAAIPPPTAAPLAPAAAEPAQPRDCGCRWAGTHCRNDACVFDPDARWHLSLWALKFDTKGEMPMPPRFCLRVHGESEWRCSGYLAPKPYDWSQKYTHYVRPSDSITLEVRSRDLVDPSGLDFELRYGTGASVRRLRAAHRGLKPGDALFQGGLVYKTGVAETPHVVFKLQPAE